MPLRWRFVVIAACYVVVLALGALLTAGALRDWSRALDERRAYAAANLRVERITSAYLVQDTGVRGYLITGRADFLETYEQGVRDVSALVGEVRRVAGLDVSVVEALASVERTGREWRTHVAEVEISARRSGDQAMIDRLVSADLGRSIFTDLRDSLDDLGEQLTASNSAFNEDAVSARRWAIGFMAGTLAVAVILTIAMVVAFERWVVGPLRRVAEGAERVRAGGEAALPEGGVPELATVVRAVDDMQRAIRSERDAAVTAREAVEQNAVLALQMRGELTRVMGDFPTGWRVAAGLSAAEGLVAGDCYDVSLLSPTEIGIVVLDIGGHGANAAVSAFRCNELLQVALRNGLDPGDALGWVYEQEHGLNDMFFTAFVATIDTETGECLYANAGHPPAVLVVDGGDAHPLGPTGPLVFSSIPPGWSTRRIGIPRDTLLGIYTDGLIEARDGRREFFGERRLFDLLARADGDVQAIVSSVLRELSAFHPGRLRDDATLVVLSHA